MQQETFSPISIIQIRMVKSVSPTVSKASPPTREQGASLLSPLLAPVSKAQALHPHLAYGRERKIPLIIVMGGKIVNVGFITFLSNTTSISHQ